MAAVSARRIRPPRVTISKSACLAASSSPLSQPPFGPITAVIFGACPPGNVAPSRSEKKMRKWSAAPPLTKLLASIGSPSSISFARPHCFEASRMMRCQRSAFFLISLSLSSHRADVSGTNVVTPNSTAFWITRSYFSPGIATAASVRSSRDSAAAARISRIIASRARFLSIESIRQTNSRPRPSSTETSSPGSRRRTLRA